MLIIASILLGIILLLAIPVDLRFRVERDLSFRSRLAIRWLFGLVGKDFDSRERRPESKRERTAEDKRSRKSSKKGKIRAFLAVLRTRGFLTRVLRLARQVLSSASPQQMTLKLRLGLEDPAETGFMFGLLGPVLVGLAGFRWFSVVAEPDFAEARLQLDFQGNLRVFPVQIAGILLVFLLSPPTLRAVKAMVVSSVRK